MNKPRPSSLATRLFKWYCNPHLQEPILGDLEEQFDQDYSLYGQAKAQRRFIWNVIGFCRPGIIRKLEGTRKLNYYGMFKNYFRITWRSLFRQKLYSSINIGGLAIGISSFLLISIYVQHEKSFDSFYPNSENIYRVYQRQHGNIALGTDLFAVTPAALAPTLMKDYPEVDYATTVKRYNTLLLAKNEPFVEDVLFGDEQLFNVFQHEFITGDPATALATKTGAVLTESMAKRMFGYENPLGQKILFWNGKEASVTGVIKDLPSNSSLSFSCILSLQASSYYQRQRPKQKWNGNSYHTFFILKEGSNPRTFETKIQEVLEKYWAGKRKNTYFVSKMTDFHLRNDINSDFGIKGNPKQLALFSLVAILVLVLACFNYMNLAIARSVKRAKEVGLRKAVGAEKQQIIFQFLGESIFLSLLSLLLGLALLWAFTPIFSELVDRQLSIEMIYHLNLIPIMFVLVIMIGIVAGSYPALYMSTLDPAVVFKGKVTGKSRGAHLQKGLIVLQYAVSIAMITVSLVIYLQMGFISEKDLGFQKDQILTMEMRSPEMRENVDVLREIFFANPTTSEVSFSTDLPTDIRSSTYLKNDRTGGNIYRLFADEKFAEVYELELLAGRFIDDNIDTEEKRNFVLNETAANALGYTAESAVGQVFVNEDEPKTIVGVVKDFHMHSMHIPIAPLMIGVREYRYFISMKVNPKNIPQTIEFLDQTLSEYSSYPFEATFVDDHFNDLYKDDLRQGEIFGFFTVLAILIACLGLFGLAAFMINQRTKEMGIRKVLGATMKDIVVSFSHNFMSLVSIGFLVAIPAAWYLSSNWLESFAYRIKVEWWIYVLGGFGALLLAFLTISSQSIKASLVNPVESLRDE